MNLSETDVWNANGIALQAYLPLQNFDFLSVCLGNYHFLSEICEIIRVDMAVMHANNLAKEDRNTLRISKYWDRIVRMHSGIQSNYCADVAAHGVKSVQNQNKRVETWKQRMLFQREYKAMRWLHNPLLYASSHSIFMCPYRKKLHLKFLYTHQVISKSTRPDGFYLQCGVGLGLPCCWKPCIPAPHSDAHVRGKWSYFARSNSESIFPTSSSGKWAEHR